MFITSKMEVTRIKVTVRELTEGYTDYTDTDIEKGVFAYNGKLCVRPAFQRSFVYNREQENEVIKTVMQGFPLNIMYWIPEEDRSYSCMDGQQRTISLCKFVNGLSNFETSWFSDDGSKRNYAFVNLRHQYPELIERFLDYELEVYICRGSKEEQMAWFRTINLGSEKLYPQELRNAYYTGKWLYDAKKYFSRANSSSTAKTPAELICGDGKKYSNKNPNRQELLEQVISWYIDSKEDADICEYMAQHQFDNDASEIINYWNNVINWVKAMFDNDYSSSMASINWGTLYNKYYSDDFDTEEVAKLFHEYKQYKDEGELDVSISKIVEFTISKDEKLLKPRAFTPAMRNVLYNRQKGYCGECGKHFELKDMQAHHIIPYYNGGKTILENGVLLCKECHKQKHL